MTKKSKKKKRPLFPPDTPNTGGTLDTKVSEEKKSAPSPASKQSTITEPATETSPNNKTAVSPETMTLINIMFVMTVCHIAMVAVFFFWFVL